MNKIKISIIVLLISFLILAAVPLHAISEATCIFLLIEPGSRAGGMGHSYVSVANDAFTSWWNPGGLAHINGSDLGLMHSKWFGDIFDDIYYEYLGYTQQFEGIGTLGFNITYMTYGEQTATDEQGEEIKKFTSDEIALGLAFGSDVGHGWTLGTNAKVVISRLAPLIPGTFMDSEGIGYAWVMDIGALKRDLIVPDFSFGVNLQNFGPKMSYQNSTQKQPMPTNLKLGFSYKIFNSQYNKLIASVDFNKMLVDSDPDVSWIQGIFTSFGEGSSNEQLKSVIQNYGVEYTYYDLISLRAGYVNDIEGHIQGMSFGAGLQYEFSEGKELAFDFAIQPAGELTDNNKTFSLGFKF
ncbi:MAG: PorV/PorQ family protein [Candidatus Cloacimonetes bacterium]|nr:PorV/PorQ family protein [Candidatus Cloacimonadota bacterium]